jgi:hypothetical protein
VVRLHIICEGESESKFVQSVLAPYLYRTNHLDVRAPILKSPKATDQSKKGGNVTFERVKDYINNLLISDKECYVSTMIDLYGIGKDFPNYDKIMRLIDSYEQVDGLENSISNHFNNDMRIIPYIQLHEYETLYFADLDNFLRTDPQLFLNKASFEKIRAENSNPELINNGRETAPSKRIENLFEKSNLSYGKVIYSQLYSQNCDLERILESCPHFKKWIEKLCAIK